MLFSSHPHQQFLLSLENNHSAKNEVIVFYMDWLFLWLSSSLGDWYILDVNLLSDKELTIRCFPILLAICSLCWLFPMVSRRIWACYSSFCLVLLLLPMFWALDMKLITAAVSYNVSFTFCSSAPSFQELNTALSSILNWSLSVIRDTM